MISITNRKVGGITPRWAPFRGYSLLFDNPGQSLSPYGREGRLEVMDSRPDDPELAFYRTFWDHSKQLEQLFRTYLMCPLPFSSYHVTVWDGINDGNVGKIVRDHRLEAEQMLGGLPACMLTDSPYLQAAGGEPVAIRVDGAIRFAYDQLWNGSNNALVVRLKAADEQSALKLKQLEHARSELTADFKERFGVMTAAARYAPHVSLGYFANKELGEMSGASVARLDDQLRKASEGKTIAFPGISLYAMTSMETFIRVR